MADQPTNPRPVVLCILDGWGERSERADNAIALARTPNWDAMIADCPHARLDASEGHVGLPSGQMGNSEVGHMNLGAGRVVLQDLPRIDAALADGSLAQLPTLLEFLAAVKSRGGAVHLMGLMSPGGVHSHQDHIAKLAKIVIDAGLSVVVHAFLDGRDTPPSSALEYMKAFEAAAPRARLGSVVGRYFALDRDKRWNRVSKAYDLMVSGVGDPALDGAMDGAADGVAAVQAAYDRGETDEFVLPTAIDDYAGMADGDGLLMANFRADRAREILGALVEPDFDGFERSKVVKFAAALGVTSYSDALDTYFETLFPSIALDNVLGAIVSDAGLTQLRIAETEKYAHVTFFFNGGVEAEFTGETRILVPSPDVATYDLQPEMSAPELTDRLTGAIESGAFDLIIVNFANTDMVGHTGILDAATRAVEAVDSCLGRLRRAIATSGGAMIVTADHGNAELMMNAETGQAHTAHTLNPAPIILVGDQHKDCVLVDGKLADIAPTLLSLLGLPKAEEMTGRSLIVSSLTGKAEDSRAAE
jgi:2,3-bisphosphoglycerate-independent phosphoglycerate mutase